MKILCVLFVCVFLGFSGDFVKSYDKDPTILVAILVRNKAHTLPYFLSLLGGLNYPKNRIGLWIRSDHNIDKTIDVLNTWLTDDSSEYHSIYQVLDDEPQGFEGEKGIADWSNDRFSHVIMLREAALNYARLIWADYIFMLDSDVFLTNPETLNLLIDKDYTVVAPMLKSDGMYSNFWAGMTSEFYYKRTEEYLPILNREKLGCHVVSMIHSAVLVDLREAESDLLTYKPENLKNYEGPRDDIITFALGANSSGIPLHVCNDEIYGFVTTPLETEDELEIDYQQLTNLKVDLIARREPLPLAESMRKFVKYPKKDSLGMDKIFMINLERRPKRRAKMELCFQELGIDVEIINAVDGRSLDEKRLNDWKIKMMPEYADPYHKRPMKMGEIGCFLSHFLIWNKVIDNHYDKVMVLEDDVRFEPFFRKNVEYIMKEEIEKLRIPWDIVYLGRKRMQEQDEPVVEGAKYLVHAGYSYWTLGYILSRSGAKKLLDAKPLEKLVPVDEYLPILFDKHPRTNWKNHFPERDLIALSSAPLLLYPSYYTGEDGYISDTEDSTIISMGAETEGEILDKSEL